MVASDVSEFVGHDGFEPVCSEFVAERVGEEDIAEVWDESHDCGVEGCAVGSPDEDVADFDVVLFAHVFEVVAEFAGWERLGAPCESCGEW